jgi:site-specific recombinase XerD
LLTFASARLRTTPSALTLAQLDADLVGAFLEQLDTARRNGAATRNVRLAAIRAFFRFLEHRQPAALDQIRRIVAIPFKRRDLRLVPYLTTDEVHALVNAPSPTTRPGIRDRAMLHLTICAGLRVSELTGLRLDDVAAQGASIRVRGKGRRERALPLWKSTATALRAWLAIRGTAPAPEVFVNARGQPFSRWGVAHLLRCHGAIAQRSCTSLAEKRLSPHVLRHYLSFLTMSGDVRQQTVPVGDAEKRAGPRPISPDIVFRSLQAVEKSQELITGAVPGRAALRRAGLGERLFLHRQGCLQIDLRGLHGLMAEPQRDDRAIDTCLE